MPYTLFARNMRLMYSDSKLRSRNSPSEPVRNDTRSVTSSPWILRKRLRMRRPSFSFAKPFAFTSGGSSRKNPWR